MTTHHPDKHAVTVEQHDAPDAWHRHTADEKPQHAHGEAANAHVIIFVGVGSFVLIILTVVITYAYYTWYTTRLLAEGENTVGFVEGDSAAYKARAQADLQHYNWVDPNPPLVPVGTVQIPIDKAMDKVVARYTQAPSATPRSQNTP
jgi:hypothetical protein